MKSIFKSAIHLVPKEYRNGIMALASEDKTASSMKRLLLAGNAPKEDIEAALREFEDMIGDWAERVNISHDPWLWMFMQKVTSGLRNYLIKRMPESNLRQVEGPAEMSKREKEDLERARQYRKRIPSAQPALNQEMIRDIGGKPWSMGYGQNQEQVGGVTMQSNHVDHVVKAMLDLADAADEAGMTKEADALSAVLPYMRIMKLAQYEGFQHYWLMNGRAFEKSWREKRKKRATDDSQYHFGDDEWYNSANECWWDSLEEFQRSLDGDHEEWLDKYAGRARPSDDGEVEQADMGSSGTVMSKGMTDFAKSIKEKARKENKTIGQVYSEWLETHQAGMTLFMEKVANKISGGDEPGVAFCEVMDEFVSGCYASEVSRMASDALLTIKVAADKIGDAALNKRADDALRLTAGFWGGLKNMLGMGDARRLFNNISVARGEFFIWLNRDAMWRGNVPRAEFARTYRPLHDYLVKYYQMMGNSGWRGVDAQMVPSMDFFGEQTQLDQASMLQFKEKVLDALAPVSEQLADKIDAALNTSKPLSERTEVVPDEDSAKQRATISMPKGEQMPAKMPVNEYVTLTRVQRGLDDLGINKRSKDKLLKEFMGEFGRLASGLSRRRIIRLAVADFSTRIEKFFSPRLRNLGVDPARIDKFLASLGIISPAATQEVVVPEEQTAPAGQAMIPGKPSSGIEESQEQKIFDKVKNLIGHGISMNDIATALDKLLIPTVPETNIGNSTEKRPDEIVRRRPVLAPPNRPLPPRILR